MENKNLTKKELQDLVWDICSLYGNEKPIKKINKNKVSDRREILLSETIPSGTPLSFYRVKVLDTEFITDGGKTSRYLEKAYCQSKSKTVNMIKRIIGASNICMIGDEIAISTNDGLTSEEATTKLREFIERVIAVSHTLALN